MTISDQVDVATDGNHQHEGTAPKLAEDVTVTVCQHGLTGEFRLIPTLSSSDPASDAATAQITATNLPLGLGEDYLLPHDLRAELESEFLTPPSTSTGALPHSLLPHVQYHLETTSKPVLSSPERFLNLAPFPTASTIAFARDPFTGKPTGTFREIHLDLETELAGDATNSTSLKRDPAPASAYVRGKSTQVPFLPGGLDRDDLASSQVVHDVITDMLTDPPGLTRGLILIKGDEEVADGVGQESLDLVSLMTNAPDAAEAAIFDQLQDEAEDQDAAGDEHAVLVESLSAAKDDSAPTESANEDADAVLAAVGEDDSSPATALVSRADIQDAQTEWAHLVTDPMHHFHTSVPHLAHAYPFELDTFQKQAVYHLERGDSVFVAAHTSAGKTVVAEYAIALARKHLTRAVYTSPIKALSNQKYRDFTSTFGDNEVGIITGDVQINPEAGCLIMTTEILRSMLYKGADLVRDLEYVIIDEAHYLNDASRGVVWEEVIIMLPSHVQLILLSATVPNVREFADWIGRTKKKDIYVMSTTHRPVPLEHYLYVPSAKEYFRFVDSERRFISDGIKKANDHILGIGNKTPEQLQQLKLNASGRGGGRGGAGGRGGRGGGRGGGNAPTGKIITHQRLDRTAWTTLVGVLHKKDLLPVTVFVFSRKACEEYADALISKDMLTAAEKSEVHVFIERSVARLRDEDRKLPQILRMREMLGRGVAVHHSGLLPLVKEMVEILFSRGLVKVLFATETFAMGVNMPTRCVVFAHVRKHDGTSFRDLLPGEYTQMSGRAGRRGLDATGMVIIMCLDSPDTTTLHNMVLGPPTKLASQFRLTFNMILNLLRVETLKVEEMMKRSFSENVSQKMLPEAEREFIRLQQELQVLPPLQCLVCAKDLDSFYDACTELAQVSKEMSAIIVGHPVGAKALTQGRVVVVSSAHHHGAVGVVVSKQRSTTQLASAGVSVSVFVLTDKQGAGAAVVAAGSDPEDAAKLTDESLDSIPLTRLHIPDADRAAGQIVRVGPTDIALVTPDTISVNPTALQHAGGFETGVAVRELRQYAVANDGKLREYDWGKIRDLEFQERATRKAQLMDKVRGYQSGHCPDLLAHFSRLHKERTIQSNLHNLRKHLTAENLELLPEYHQRMAVLEHLGFVDPRTRTVQLKGRVACEINTCDEVLLTELVLNNLFADLDVPEMVAVLSVLIFQEKNDLDSEFAAALEKADVVQAEGSAATAEAGAVDVSDGAEKEATLVARWPPRLIQALRQVRDTARRVVTIQAEFGIDGADPDLYIKTNLRYGLVEVVYEWARGLPFQQIMGLTNVLEGSIVRCIHRLEDTCREVRDAARLVGDGALYQKMDAAEAAIKRDIVFCGSLYL